ncbi:hypothetical protein GCM10027066_09440 [Dyella jejuensis]
MDNTVTPVGSQVLFSRLREYVADSEVLAQRYAIYMQMASNEVLREALQLPLSKLSDESNADLADILFGERRERSPNRAFIRAWSLLSLTSLALLMFSKLSPWWWLVAVFINVGMIFRDASREHRESEAMKHCGTLLNVADELAKMHALYPSLPQLTQLQDEAPQRAVVRKALFWFGLSKVPPFSLAFAVLNFAFLIDLMISVGTIERFF